MFSIADLDPYESVFKGLPGSGSASWNLIPDPDPAVNKSTKERKNG